MPIRIYVAPQIGSGMMIDPNPSNWTDATGPYRSLLNKYIDSSAGDRFEEIDHPGRKISICCVTATAAAHTAIEADPAITPVIPRRAVDAADLSAILSAPLASYPLAWRTAARSKMESWGIDTSWITGSTTMKDLLTRLIRILSVAQVAAGHGAAADTLGFLGQNLEMIVSAIPPAQRSAIGDWLRSRGIDTSWITGTTTVREIAAILPAGFRQLYGRDVPISFAGVAH